MPLFIFVNEQGKALLNSDPEKIFDSKLPVIWEFAGMMSLTSDRIEDKVHVKGGIAAYL